METTFPKTLIYSALTESRSISEQISDGIPVFRILSVPAFNSKLTNGPIQDLLQVVLPPLAIRTHRGRYVYSFLETDDVEGKYPENF